MNALTLHGQLGGPPRTVLDALDAFSQPPGSCESPEAEHTAVVTVDGPVAAVLDAHYARSDDGWEGVFTTMRLDGSTLYLAAAGASGIRGALADLARILPFTVVHVDRWPGDSVDHLM
jgi:hypothetical protein